MVLYPDGYGTTYLTLDAVEERHGERMHPEFRRRLFAWLESMVGVVGIGGGYRPPATQPDRPGFAPEGKSFHQDQRFADGFVGYCAVDIVTVDGPDPGDRHDGVTWSLTDTAPSFGLHAFIRTPRPEPWHVQPIEIRGWQSWRNMGSPPPAPFFPLPTTHPPTEGTPDMARLFYFALPPADMPDNPPHFVVVDGAVRYRTNADIDASIPEIRLPRDQYDALRSTVGI